ncbi:MAG: YqgE/AlgH family protein [Hydrogenovibrio sp.]|nr:YqgE/AlgH family protein [Hydrogenovibrio sp.]
MTSLNSFQHQILIAMPSLADTWFEKTVIYMVEDNEHGSMGLVLNLPHNLTVGQLLEHFKLPVDDTQPFYEDPVLMGGPVDMEHGFVLHKSDPCWQKSMPLEDRLSMTVSEDLLKAIAAGDGPEQFLACLGFAGWEKGQLEKEIQENSWLTIPYNESLLFEVPVDSRWEVALATLGISPEHLSLDAGHD